MEMINTDVGDNANSARNDVSSKPPISPAARKFAEYLARRMAPQIEHAGRQNTTPNHTVQTNSL
jgi:NADH dehydrogenase FAD-containing subunit